MKPELRPPTVYEVVITIGLFVTLCFLFLIHQSQMNIQRDYVTKDYIYNFYITKGQIQYIEEERARDIARVQKGEDYRIVTEEFCKKVEKILMLRTRGL